MNNSNREWPGPDEDARPKRMCTPVDPGDRSTVLALAAAVALAFPDLKGNAVPVTVTEPDKQTMPALPLAVVAIDKVRFKGGGQRNSLPIQTEELLLEFWLPPDRYPLKDGRPSALWSFYDYQAQIDDVLAFIWDWESPWGSYLELTGMDQSTDDYAVYLTFHLTHPFKWRPPAETQPDARLKIAPRIGPASIPAPGCTCTPPADNCPSCNIITRSI